MSRVVNTALLVVAIALVYFLNVHQSEAASLSTRKKEKDAVEIMKTNTSPLQTLKRSPRSKMVFEVVIDFGKNKKRKKQKGKHSMKSKRRRNKNRRNRRRKSHRGYPHRYKPKRAKKMRLNYRKKNNPHRYHKHHIRSRQKQRKKEILIKHGDHYHTIKVPNKRRRKPTKRPCSNSRRRQNNKHRANEGKRARRRKSYNCN